MSIITIATTKGGAGKTTLARLILARAALAGLKPAAIDVDFNHTLTDWVTAVAKYPITVRHELDETRIGPVLGLGVERAIWGNWTTRLEYMYADFGKTRYAFNAPPPYNTVSSGINFGEHILRVGLNYRFN